jgi:hypothetical protein
LLVVQALEPGRNWSVRPKFWAVFVEKLDNLLFPTPATHGDLLCRERRIQL